VPCNFCFWRVNGLPRQPRQTDIQLFIEADTAVEAVYAVAGDVDGDCRVNVLDLLLIRNRLNRPISTNDNWPADVNLDGAIDVLDLLAARQQIGTHCPDEPQP